MARVPLVGRLFWHEYIALVGSLTLILLEGIIRIITLGLPQPVIRFCYNRSRSAFNWLSTSHRKQGRSPQKSFVSSIANAADFIDLCALHGYVAEEHIVATGDGYLLGLHRLCHRRGEEGAKVNAGDDSIRKRVVYLHHGLLMNNRGYDVWLGNNRGNKYSKKSSRYSPASNAFWDFSMDQFAFHDIPDGIDYILATTSVPSLSYIGFSQGTAQAFAALSTHPKLNDRVNVFIGLAPAMSPAGLKNGVVDSLVKASPEVLFLAFGRRSILSSATMWQTILYPPIFVRILDLSLSFLFDWSGKNISLDQKLAAYPHLYSFTSTKSVVHWFQIIRNKSFQMYDDDVQTPLPGIGARDRYYKVARFPTRNIKTPIVLFYGGSDSLVDITVMLRQLPRHTIARELPHYEHLDFLWGEEVASLVFPHVFEALDTYSPPSSSLLPMLPPRQRIVDASSITGYASYYSEEDDEERSSNTTDPTSASVEGTDRKHAPPAVGSRHSSLGSPNSTSRPHHHHNSNKQQQSLLHKRIGSHSSLRSNDSNSSSIHSKKFGNTSGGVGGRVGGGINPGTGRATTSVIEHASPPSNRNRGRLAANNVKKPQSQLQPQTQP